MDIMNAVNDRVKQIKAARALIPVMPSGSSPGTIQAVGAYVTVIAGQRTTVTGLMFQEPATSDYGKWLGAQLKQRYSDAVTAWNTSSDPSESPATKKSRWGAVGMNAATIATFAQEGAPSAINTYDGRVSWGAGIAAKGYLEKVMYFIVQDPKVAKVFYCCGFLYDADIRANRDKPDQYHGKYQGVDLARSIPAIIYGDDWYHDDVPRDHKKGDYNVGRGYLAFRALAAQRELLHMFIQVARDPETRDGVFLQNYNFISKVVTVQGFEKLNSEALYVFIAQVQHNWGIAGKGPVAYAISTFDSGDPAPADLPSEAGDKAIAKGVVRLLMKVLQEQRFQNDVRFLKKGVYPAGLSAAARLKDFSAATEYGLTRLIKNYWSALQSGANTQDKSTVVVSDFLVPAASSPAGNYLWTEKDMAGTTYDFGSATKMHMRFQHDDFTVQSIVDDRTVQVRDERTGATHNEDTAPR